jgi:hypothetical protein
MKTDISIVLDRSGSMASVRTDTIGGFNTFIEEQRKQPGECAVSLVQFDDSFEVLYTEKSVQDAPLLTPETFLPRGSTALLDAIGRTIVATGARLSAIHEAMRPEKVIFVIITDGQENASKEFSKQQIADMIKLQRETYKWDFVFLGANQDAIAVGGSLGVARDSSLTYAHDGAGTRSAFMSTSGHVSSLRASGHAKFSEADRLKQKR